MYNEIEVLGPLTESKICSGILSELSHQMNYRPTSESLWAKVKLDGAELYRVTFVNKNRGQVWNIGSDERYEFMPLEEYSFAQVAFL
jgi:hypothetical protein